MDKIVFLEPVFCGKNLGGRNLEKFDFLFHKEILDSVGYCRS